MREQALDWQVAPPVHVLSFLVLGSQKDAKSREVRNRRRGEGKGRGGEGRKGKGEGRGGEGKAGVCEHSEY